MKEEEQNEAIANACKLKKYASPAGPYWYHEDWIDCQDGHTLDEVPDFVNDLNDMHEAEKVLTNDTLNEKYCMILHEVSGADQFPSRVVIFATASQRAEAFLRTLNLWTN